MATLEELREAVVDGQAKVAVAKNYADEIGADGYAEEASSAIRMVKEVLAA
jgi:methanogenic corrinoid protein MtbC1